LWRFDPSGATFYHYPVPEMGPWEVEVAPILPQKTAPDIVFTSQQSSKLDFIDSSRNPSNCAALDVNGNNPCVTSIDLASTPLELAFDTNRRIWFAAGTSSLGYVEHQSKQVIRMPPLSVFPFELAERKEATQSTNFDNAHDASRAVDGDVNTYAA